MSPPGTSHRSVLNMHGITVDTVSPSQRQKELRLRHDVEMKQKSFEIKRQEEMMKKETLQSSLSSSSATSFPGAPSVDSQDVVQEAKRQHQAAIFAFAKAQKELESAKQAYGEVARSNVEAQKAKERGSSSMPRPMTIEALELQHQGFKLMETLISKDPEYLLQHNDVVRAFRWLWRSKGRHLRMLHEESMPSRYHEESKMLATFLVDYSQEFPNDVDVLFDLIRIFLQPTSVDFTFVKRFLDHMASHVLGADQKKNVVQRFFALLGSEGSEETKLLSIQLLVLPMLKNDFEMISSSGSESLEGQSAIKGSWAAKVKINWKNVKSKPLVPGMRQDNTEGSKSEGVKPSGIVNKDMARKFVHEVLFQDGIMRNCGSRLNVELLKLSILLLEYLWEPLFEHRKDLIKFSWCLLKSDDISTKHWAYVNVCQFISVYDTPPKNIMQVYIGESVLEFIPILSAIEFVS